MYPFYSVHPLGHHTSFTLTGVFFSLITGKIDRTKVGTVVNRRLLEKKGIFWPHYEITFPGVSCLVTNITLSAHFLLAAKQGGRGGSQKWLSNTRVAQVQAYPHLLLTPGGSPQISNLPPVFILAPPPPSLLPQRTLFRHGYLTSGFLSPLCCRTVFMRRGKNKEGGGAAKINTGGKSKPSLHALGPPQISSLPPVFILAAPPSPPCCRRGYFFKTWI